MKGKELAPGERLYLVRMRLEFRDCIVAVIARNEDDAKKEAAGGEFELVQEGECVNWTVEDRPVENRFETNQ